MRYLCWVENAQSPGLNQYSPLASNRQSFLWIDGQSGVLLAEPVLCSDVPTDSEVRYKVESGNPAITANSHISTQVYWLQTCIGKYRETR